MPTRLTLPTERSRRLFGDKKGYLLDLCHRLDAANDFTFDDWEILFHLLENYRPDGVLEVGRGAGNTTCVFLDYCSRHLLTEFISVDLYDNWHQHSEALLPNGLVEKAKAFMLLHLDFYDFDCSLVTNSGWAKTLIFWDLSDIRATRRLIAELLPMFSQRDVVVVAHDVGFRTGRPRRYHWREYESIYPDLAIVGPFIDENGWLAGVLQADQIFGSYRNAGHWLVFGPTSHRDR